MANVVEQVKFVIQVYCVDIKKPCTCKRQTNRLNAVPSSHSISEESIIEQYFRVNLTIPFLDKVIENLHSRFAEGQDTVLKGILLIPPYVVTHESWEQSVDPFIQHCIDELPCSLTINADLAM